MIWIIFSSFIMARRIIAKIYATFASYFKKRNILLFFIILNFFLCKHRKKYYNKLDLPKKCTFFSFKLTEVCLLNFFINIAYDAAYK